MEHYWMNLLLGLADAYRYALLIEQWPLARQYATSLPALTALRDTLEEWVDVPALRPGTLKLLEDHDLDCRTVAGNAGSITEGTTRWWIEYYQTRIDQAFNTLYVEIDEGEGR